MIDPRIKIRHLQCFLVVARTGHLGRAADELAITQPAVTKTVRELEEILGVRLFERTQKGVRPTGPGQQLMHHTAAGVLTLQQGLESVVHGGRREAHLRVGALPTVAARLVPRAVESFTRLSDGPVVVSLLTGHNRFLLERLRGAEIDVIVGRLADLDQTIGLSFEQLYSERLALVTRPGHPLAASRALDPRKIGGFMLVLPTEEDIIRPTAERFLIANGIAASPRRVETVSSDFARVFLSESDAVWLISYGVVALDLEAGILVELDADMRDTSGPVGMTTRADERPSAELARFMQVIRETVRDRHLRDAA